VLTTMSDAFHNNKNTNANNNSSLPLKEENETMVGLGKRARDASLNDQEDEPQVRKARSQQQDSFQTSDKIVAKKLEDYLADPQTYAPRPEWYRSFSSGQKRPREEDNNNGDSPNNAAEENRASRAQAQVSPPLVAAAQQQHQHQRAPADGLLPNNAFVVFLQQQQQQAMNASRAAATSSTIIPQAEQQQQTQQQQAEDTPLPQSINSNNRLETFGRDCSSALHIAIRNNKPLAALDLIQHGASVNAENGRAVTPMVLACQKGMYQVVQELYKRGACIQQSSHSGSTPLIQACHFGHLDIVQFLIFRGANIQTPNLHNTTPLMRAAQEGHYEICDLLLKHGAHVNCRNTEHMSALMLAAQRGHAKVCQLLIDKGRAELNATTLQSSTPLMLACKRGHAEVVQVLLTAGCELSIRDSRGRTARDTAKRRQNFALMQLLDPDVQLHLMQMSIRKVRNLEMLKLWTLLQQERAHVPLMHSVRVSIHHVHKYLRINKGSKSALIRTMTLPAPLVELIATFLPLPRLWEWRSALIVRKCTVDPDAAVAASLEIIDEVLDEGGFVHACDEAHVTPPTNFSSWREWKVWDSRSENNNDRDTAFADAARQPERHNILLATLPGLARFVVEPADNVGGSTLLHPTGATPERSNESYVQRRRGMCFLQLLAHRTTMLARVLNQPPYNMPAPLIQKLITVSDVQSLSRRMGSQGVHFEASVAVEMLVLVNSVCAWYTCMRCEEQEAIGSPAQYRAYASLDDDGSPNSGPDLAALES
jgi:ankyrin repeat protein